MTLEARLLDLAERLALELNDVRGELRRATTHANSTTVFANYTGFAAPLLAMQQRLLALGA